VLSAFFLAVSLAALPAFAADVSTVTLRQCYGLAHARSEELKSREEEIIQSHERARSALSGALPRLNWEFVDTWQDPEGVRRLDAQGFSGFIAKEQGESRFALRQTLFSGLKEYNALRGFKKEEARDAWRLKRFERELYETTASAYYAVVGSELERDNTAESLAAALDRVKDLRGFLKLGKARESELFTAQAHAAALKAALRRSESRVSSARSELSYLTGVDLSRAGLVDELPDEPEAGSLADALELSRSRSDVKAQREDAAAQEMRVNYEKGAYWPSLDVLGRYYTGRATFMKEIKWDVGLSLDVPLFQGGRVSADARRAESAYRQSRLMLEAVERRAAYMVSRIHGELVSAVSELRAQEEAALAAGKSYDALRGEYRLGLVTNLDVLQALDLLQSQRAERNAARLQAKRLAISLGVATERLP
jgi:outer membrane protein TolC